MAKLKITLTRSLIGRPQIWAQSKSRRKTIHALKLQIPSDTLALPLTHCVTLNKMLKISVSVKWGS